MLIQGEIANNNSKTKKAMNLRDKPASAIIFAI